MVLAFKSGKLILLSVAFLKNKVILNQFRMKYEIP